MKNLSIALVVLCIFNANLAYSAPADKSEEVTIATVKEIDPKAEESIDSTTATVREIDPKAEESIGSTTATVEEIQNPAVEAVPPPAADAPKVTTNASPVQQEDEKPEHPIASGSAVDEFASASPKIDNEKPIIVEGKTEPAAPEHDADKPSESPLPAPHDDDPTNTTTTTTTTTSSTTIDPNTTTSSTTTSSTTTVDPKTTTPSTTTTTADPSPTPTTVKPSPVPDHDRSQFSVTAFIGGMVFAFGMMAIGFIAFKFYKARNERNYHTL